MLLPILREVEFATGCFHCAHLSGATTAIEHLRRHLVVLATSVGTAKVTSFVLLVSDGADNIGRGCLDNSLLAKLVPSEK
jgi:hypothetical protein